MAAIEIILYALKPLARVDVESDVINRGRCFTWRRASDVRPDNVQIITFFSTADLRRPHQVLAPAIVEHSRTLISLEDAEKIATDIVGKIQAVIDEQGHGWTYVHGQRFIDSLPVVDAEPLAAWEIELLNSGEFTPDREANALLD